jgi:hypothetical protein
MLATSIKHWLLGLIDGRQLLQLLQQQRLG